jgi:hypothetical protein
LTRLATTTTPVSWACAWYSSCCSNARLQCIQNVTVVVVVLVLVVVVVLVLVLVLVRAGAGTGGGGGVLA